MNLEDILRLNPHIDATKLEETLEYLRKLGNKDGKARKPRPPFGGKRVSAGGAEDSRTVHLRRTQ